MLQISTFFLCLVQFFKQDNKSLEGTPEHPASSTRAALIAWLTLTCTFPMVFCHLCSSQSYCEKHSALTGTRINFKNQLRGPGPGGAVLGLDSCLMRSIFP